MVIIKDSLNGFLMNKIIMTVVIVLAVAHLYMCGYAITYMVTLPYKIQKYREGSKDKPLVIKPKPFSWWMDDED